MAKEGFSNFVFKQMHNSKQFSKLMRLGEEFPTDLTIFLKERPDLLWLHEIFLHQFYSASETLHVIVSKLVTFIRRKALERVSGKSLHGLPLGKFDYDSIYILSIYHYAPKYASIFVAWRFSFLWAVIPFYKALESSGAKVMIYDLRSSTPLQVKDHMMLNNYQFTSEVITATYHNITGRKYNVIRIKKKLPKVNRNLALLEDEGNSYGYLALFNHEQSISAVITSVANIFTSFTEMKLSKNVSYKRMFMADILLIDG
ncbi:Nucleoporin, Nup133/Nup155-like, C-terminal [Artemisia annua]|uniref:Nucleoporin, Nup133/Nup155-like, C-terminal n=1 Tax=Artemisia annua TaxID=35608 RepID=A0A2U1N298_ARTAN|nr:Nucleoporin, Nup133/Nup155-like, C-terminal [Artemisia annua]